MYRLASGLYDKGVKLYDRDVMLYNRNIRLYDDTQSILLP